MKNNRLLVVFLLLIACFGATTLLAQNGIVEKSQAYLSRADSILHERYHKVTYDTNYISRPKGKFLAKLYGNITGIVINASERTKLEDESGRSMGIKMSGEFRTDTRATLSLGLTYQGLTAGVTINPNSLGGHDKGEVEIGFNMYDNRFIFDVNFYVSKTFRGSIKLNNQKFLIFEKGDFKIKMLNLSAYYTFNNKRFSFPAAFNQTYVQKRSAGSFLAGFSYQWTELKARGEFKELLGTKMTEHIYYLGIGAGYGYNFVFGRENRWLIHASLLPNIVVFNKTVSKSDEGKERSHDSFPVFIFNEHLAVVHFFGPKINFFGARYMIGVTFEANDVREIRRHSGSSQNKWLCRGFIGARF